MVESPPKETYSLQAVCLNCGWTGTLTLAKGQRLNWFYIRHHECAGCGCTDTIRKAVDGK